MRLIGRADAARQQRGDTIVEVLISVAIISLILAAGYAITNRNVTTNQDTQEHNQAQQIAQQQVERLRALSQTEDVKAAYDALGGTSPKCAALSETLALKTGTDRCNISADGTPCADTACYQINITRDPVQSTVYDVVVRWDNIHGETSSVELDYGI